MARQRGLKKNSDWIFSGVNGGKEEKKVYGHLAPIRDLDDMQDGIKLIYCAQVIESVADGIQEEPNELSWQDFHEDGELLHTHSHNAP